MSGKKCNCVFSSGGVGASWVKGPRLSMVTAKNMQFLLGMLEIIKSLIFQWCTVDTVHRLSEICQISGNVYKASKGQGIL